MTSYLLRLSWTESRIPLPSIDHSWDCSVDAVWWSRRWEIENMKGNSNRATACGFQSCSCIAQKKVYRSALYIYIQKGQRSKCSLLPYLHLLRQSQPWRPLLVASLSVVTELINEMGGLNTPLYLCCQVTTTWIVGENGVRVEWPAFVSLSSSSLPLQLWKPLFLSLFLSRNGARGVKGLWDVTGRPFLQLKAHYQYAHDAGWQAQGVCRANRRDDRSSLL